MLTSPVYSGYAQLLLMQAFAGSMSLAGHIRSPPTTQQSDVLSPDCLSVEQEVKQTPTSWQIPKNFALCTDLVILE